LSDQPKNMWAARRESIAAKSYMDELLIVAARTMPDEDGNLDVGLLEPNARRTEIGRDRLNVNDTDAEACWTVEYDLDIRTARLEVTVLIRPVPRTTDNEDDDAAE
jgi:hypothetical protein